MKMNKFLIILLVLVGILVISGLAIILLTPWMDRWGATDEEISATYLGDELVPDPASIVNRAITIKATPEQIYPWIVQLGADKGGLYSYTWLEKIINCPMVNADRIHPEWQELKVGDEVKMCPGTFGPPPYKVAILGPLYTVVMGHEENGAWSDVWQFVIEPLANGNSRLILRTRTNLSGGIWNVIHPGVFIMERGMLMGIKDRAESMAK
jgi:hypothetical protein